MQQVRSVLELVLVAWLLGAVFDVYNTVTDASKWLRWLRPVFDLAFWVAAAGLVFFVMFTTDDGRLRFYTFLILAAGYGLYRVMLHQQVVLSAFRVVRTIRLFVLALGRGVYVVLIWPLWAMVQGIRSMLSRCYQLLRRTEDGLFAVLRFTGKVFTFLLRGHSEPARALQKKIDVLLEGIWQWASKWIRRTSGRT